MATILPVPFHPQESDAGCVLACAQMMLAFLGIRRSQPELARVLGVDPLVGTPGPRLRRLNSPDLEVVYTEGELSAVENWLEQRLPVMMFVQTAQLDYWEGLRSQHAIVVIGLDEKNATILDPVFPASENPKQILRLELQVASGWMRHRYVVIRRR